jgi:hypothetical protein
MILCRSFSFLPTFIVSTLYIETLKQQRRKKGKESADETGNGGIEFTGNSCQFLAPKN